MNQIKGKRTGGGLWLLGGILLAVVGLALLFASRQPEKPQPPPPAAPSEQTAAEKPMSQKKKLKVIKHSADYPAYLQAFAEHYEEAIDFVYDYPTKKEQSEPVDLSAEAAGEQVPQLLQWDSRWGYLPYGDSILGCSGCGPVCLSMAALYLTGDARWTPPAVAALAEEHGFRVPGQGTSWTLMTEGAALVGLQGEELHLDQVTMEQALDSGGLIALVVGPGDFTRDGHFLLVTGYDETGFTVCDPNSVRNTEKTWPYDRLEPQILNLWKLCAAPS